MTLPDERTDYHIPVLLAEAVHLLIADSTGIYIDGTIGGGGHSQEILQRLDAHGRVFGFDQDPEAITVSRLRFQKDKRITLVQRNVLHIQKTLSEYGISSIDGLLLDLGVSSRHLDSAERGFSFQKEGPLDMRMDMASTIRAMDILRDSSVDELARIFFEYGEERNSRRIARAIADERTEQPIERTSQLAEIVRRCTPRAHANKSLARIFQALRIAVNNELEVLDRVLEDSFAVMKTGGRMVIISYHSLEDRRVKSFFKKEASVCVCPPQMPVCTCGKVQRLRSLTQKPVQPDEEEIRRNPRARSARLRAAEKIHA